jgi:cytochrome c biogenesis protein CcdA
VPPTPGYLGYVSGLTDPTPPHNRRRVLTGVGLFVLGFAVVFTLYGAAFGAFGSWLVRWQDPLMRGPGVVVILMGAALLGLVPWLQQTHAHHPRRAHGHRGLGAMDASAAKPLRDLPHAHLKGADGSLRSPPSGRHLPRPDPGIPVLLSRGFRRRP